jgi:spoIIIJ-associated protein
MSEKRANMEVIAPTAEEAVETGLAELGLTQDDVDIEILDPGSRGLFGLGSRQARVRISVKNAELEGETMVIDLTTEQKPSIPEVEETDVVVVQAKSVSTVSTKPVATLELSEKEVLEISKTVVEELLANMKVRAQVTARIAEPEDERSRRPYWVDVHGSDLSILIGPRAETLNALQHIAGLIVSKEVGRSVALVVDVEGYRARRTQQLRQLARRMADQAIKTGRRQVLEPMPASERRIVHIELRDDPEVTTESVGDEPRRKVTIIPK